VKRLRLMVHLPSMDPTYPWQEIRGAGQAPPSGSSLPLGLLLVADFTGTKASYPADDVPHDNVLGGCTTPIAGHIHHSRFSALRRLNARRRFGVASRTTFISGHSLTRQEW